MLLNLNKINWSNALKSVDFKEQESRVLDTMKNMARLTNEYNKWIQEEIKKTKEELVVS